MNEYKKKLAAMQQGQVNKESAPEAPEMTNGIPNSVLNDVFAGRRKADSNMMGHRVNLAESINAKMTQAFGMDVSQLRVYRSHAMSGTDMKGISQGNTVVLSEDVDLNTAEGQAVLGHELSHIHAQSQGIGMGHGGLYNNAALEHQADVEGMRAARGRPIYEKAVTGNPGMSYGLGMKGVEGVTPLSANGISSTAGAPMQAKKNKTAEKDLEQTKKIRAGFLDDNSIGSSFANGSFSRSMKKRLREISDVGEETIIPGLDLIPDDMPFNGGTIDSEDEEEVVPVKKVDDKIANNANNVNNANNANNVNDEEQHIKELQEKGRYNTFMKHLENNTLPDYLNRKATIKEVNETAEKYGLKPYQQKKKKWF